MFNARQAQESALTRAITAFAGGGAVQAVVPGPSPESDAEWVANAMARLEEAFAPEAVRQIRMQCQCGYGMDAKVALVRRLLEGTPSLEAFVQNPEARAAGLSAEGGELYLQFPSCPCPMLATVERLPTKTWCLCTLGYSKVLFEQAFACEVEVELLEAIKAGDARCRMRIAPKVSPWPA